jgi:protein-tyrosine kinase
MSRIHEALKKAEQERAAAAVPEVSPQAEKRAGIEAVTRESAPAPAGVAAAPPGNGFAWTPGLPSHEAMLEHCRQTLWHPDPQTMLSFVTENHTIGIEEFRTLRSRLYRIRESQKLQTLLVTSALPGEGKSFVTANLAQVIARQHERRVLLIDADLRWSRLHQSLGTTIEPGLSEYLQGQADETAILQRGPLKNLFFIAGGRQVNNPLELVASERLKVLLQRLSPYFDWIIMDSPPAGLVSDASLMADMCDGVLLVVQAGETPFDVAQKVRQELEGKRLLGVVLNRAEPNSVYSYDYYGRYLRLRETGAGKVSA